MTKSYRYTEGSKNEQGVGAGVAIFSGNELLVTKLKYKLVNRCSNNQAEQLAIAKALEALETILRKIAHALQQ